MDAVSFTGKICLQFFISFKHWDDNALYGQECLFPKRFSGPTIKVETLKKMIEEREAQTKGIREDIQAT